MRYGVVAVIALLLAAGLATPVAAQDPTSTSTTAGAPAPDIIPEPNTDVGPSEAGDRGGALQLGLLALVLVVIGGVLFALVRQSRRARGLD
jgi:hypothetical protein